MKWRRHFFRRLAVILLVYVVLLLIIYPLIAKQNFGYVYTSLLIAAMSISSFAQYYFGVVDRLLLTADQKGYIQYTAQTVTLIGNTVVCIFLIFHGANIHLVKLSTSIIYLARPLVLHIYVLKQYRMDRHAKYTVEPIKQKWNGVAQHIAAVVLDSTDIIVLSAFSTLINVSIYSVYFFVVNGIKILFTSLMSGVQSLLGEYWARNEKEKLNLFFPWLEWCIHTGAVFIWGCTFTLIIPFVALYTKEITDANYLVPMFASVITIANSVHCLRMPYNILILATGHYKQTQHNYIIAAVLNLVLSILTVKLWGLVGVAMGTLVAMTYQTTWMAVYDSKVLLKRKTTLFFKQVTNDIVTFVIGVFITSGIQSNVDDWSDWLLLAVSVAGVWMMVVIVMNTLFYKEQVLCLVNAIKKIASRKG